MVREWPRTLPMPHDPAHAEPCRTARQPAASSLMVVLRVLASALVVALGGAGWWVSGKVSRDSSARVQSVVEHHQKVAEATPARGEVREEPKDLSAMYAESVLEDLERFGVKDFDNPRFLAPNTHRKLDRSVVVDAGRRFRWSPLEIRVEHDRVTYKRDGVSVSTTHTVAVVANVSKEPVAYFLRATSDRVGHCSVKGSRAHNAMALLPGEEAHVVVCAGEGGARIERLETVTLSKLGYYYVSQLSPEAAAHEPNVINAHTPPKGVRKCTGVDTAALGSFIRREDTRWVDIVDYFSRHSCDRFTYPLGYRVQTRTVEKLPIVTATP